MKKGYILTFIKWGAGFVTGWIMFMVLLHYQPPILAFIEAAAFAVGEVFFMQEYRTTGNASRRAKMRNALFLLSFIAFIAAIQEHASHVNYADYDLDFWTWATQIFLTVLYSFARTGVLWFLSELDFKKEDAKSTPPAPVVVVEDTRTPTRIALESEEVRAALISIIQAIPMGSRRRVASDEKYVDFLIERELVKREI